MRRAVCLVPIFAVLIATAPAQSLDDVYRRADAIDDLMNEGRYVDAIEASKAAIDWLALWRHSDRTSVFLAYLGKVSVETGRLSQAASVLKSAEMVIEQGGDTSYEAVVARENAALLYATADYERAARAAAKAHSLSIRYGTVRMEYCRSLQALALLRLGRTEQARKLISAALKAMPAKPTKQTIFAPRILFTACLIESYAGDPQSARALCQRGLDRATASGFQTRDLPLGYLARAEAELQAGDLAGSRTAALTSADLTLKLFGREHQDFVDALNILARASLLQGDTVRAHADAVQALKIATALFGEGSPGLALQKRKSQDIDAALPAPDDPPR